MTILLWFTQLIENLKYNAPRSLFFSFSFSILLKKICIWSSGACSQLLVFYLWWLVTANGDHGHNCLGCFHLHRHHVHNYHAHIPQPLHLLHVLLALFQRMMGTMLIVFTFFCRHNHHRTMVIAFRLCIFPHTLLLAFWWVMASTATTVSKIPQAMSIEPTI